MRKLIALPSVDNANRIRVIAVVVIVAAFIALTVFALLARAYRPGRNGVQVPGALGFRSTTQLAQSAAAVTPAPEVSAAVVEAPAAESPGPVAPVAAAAAPAASKPASTPASNTPAPPPATNGLAPCPAGLAVPTQQAGLANLVGIVPVFGPFSPEAFAMVPAFQPAFPLFGPLIVSGGQQLDAHAAEMNTLVGVVHPLEQSGFDTVSPLYGPYRQQVLAGEASVASAMAPGAAAFASAPGASCIPAALSAAGFGH
ncbi:MAG: hypothetical protein JO086_13415 [Acidimicrobiia bacterium]|nr:hypothetical protein [Acidimicrobiia bacterium]